MSHTWHYRRWLTVTNKPSQYIKQLNKKPTAGFVFNNSHLTLDSLLLRENAEDEVLLNGLHPGNDHQEEAQQARQHLGQSSAPVWHPSTWERFWMLPPPSLSPGYLRQLLPAQTPTSLLLPVDTTFESRLCQRYRKQKYFPPKGENVCGNVTAESSKGNMWSCDKCVSLF